MAKKLTKREMFLQIREFLTEQEHVDFIDHEIELLDRKASKPSKLTRKQAENEITKEALVAGMEAKRWYTITELQNEVEAVAEYSNQKISAMLKQLVDAGKIEKRYEKRTAYFGVVTE